MECQCGYKKTNLLLGGGMFSYSKHCSFPYYCKNCESLLILNTLEEKVVCSQCQSNQLIRYDSESLSMKEPDSFNVFSWNIRGETLILKDNLYFCPQCKHYTMKIIGAGMWD